MVEAAAEWRPGSFTKNFSWGKESGLQQLHENIRIGFADTMEDVPRDEYRRRVRAQNRPDYIPINFFLFNRPRNGVDHIVADELVFQALTQRHSERFDKLALFAFVFSYAGKFKRMNPSQRRPALWANEYVGRRVALDFGWQTRRISAADIERFVKTHPNYVAEGAGKLSTNLHFMFDIGHLDGFATKRVERWWVDAVFLALDRLLGDRSLDGLKNSASEFGKYLQESSFAAVAGAPSLEKRLAVVHLVALYVACRGRRRFDRDAVEDRIRRQTNRDAVEEIERFLANDDRPRGAVHPTNPRILKSIPAICAMLAKYAGFEDLDPDTMEEFDIIEFVRRQSKQAIRNLREKGIEPTMSIDELMRLTRD